MFCYKAFRNQFFQKFAFYHNKIIFNFNKTQWQRNKIHSFWFLLFIENSKRKLIFQDNQKQSDQNINQNTHKPNCDVIFLQKKQYFDLCFYNQVDYFYLIVYDDFLPENTRQAVKAATQIRQQIQQIDKEEIKRFNVYLISQNTLKDCQKIVNRIKNFKVYEDNSQKPDPVEIFLKTPDSKQYQFYKFNKETFFTHKKIQKLQLKLSKMINLIEKVDDERMLNRILKQYFSVYNQGLIIKCIDQNDDISKMQEFKYFKRDIFNLFERKILKIQSKFIVIQNKELIEKLNLQIGETYILRNDVSEKFSGYQNVIESYFGMIEIQNLRTKLESLTSFQEKNKQFFQKFQDQFKALQDKYNSSKDKDEQKIIDKKMKKIYIENQRRLLICFSFPQICLIQNQNIGEVGSFFKRISFEKEKQVISLFLDKNESNKLEKIQILVKLYEKYKDKFHFLVVDSADLTKTFPHMHYNFSELCIFDIFDFLKSETVLKKESSRPYMKHFLPNMKEYLQSFESLDSEVQSFLQGQVHPSYLDQLHTVQIDSQGFDQLVTNKESCLIEIVDESAESLRSQRIIDALGYPQPIYRMKHTNRSQYLPLIYKTPLYVRIDNGTIRILIHPLHESLSSFLQS